MIHENSCLDTTVRPTDYIKDQNSPIVFRAATSGDWTPYLDFFERQKYSWDNDGCVLYYANESFDAQINQQIESGAIPQSIVLQFNNMGFMDSNSLDGQPRFHSSPRFLHILAGTKHNGTSLPAPWDAMRKFGVLPWKDLPFDETTTQDAYYDPAAITQAMYDKAAQFLALIGGKNAIQYHFIAQNFAPGSPFKKIAAALPQAPVGIGTPVCGDDWNNESVPLCPSENSVHVTMVYNESITHGFLAILDHYIPFLKKLPLAYNVPFALQGIVTVSVTPDVLSVSVFPIDMPPPPANIAPTQQNVTILQQIVSLYQTLLNLLKGRNNQFGSIEMNYQILKSKTFWTLVLAFVYNVWQLFAPSIKPEYSVIIDLVFSSVTTYFHMSGVTKAAVASANAQLPVSGQ